MLFICRKSNFILTFSVQRFPAATQQSAIGTSVCAYENAKQTSRKRSQTPRTSPDATYIKLRETFKIFPSLRLGSN